MKRRLAVSCAGVLAASLIVAGFSAPSADAFAAGPSRLTLLRSSLSPALPALSLPLGPVPSSAELRVDVTLRLPNPDALTAFIASLSERRSRNFHHFLRPGQFGQLFGPPMAEVAAVETLLRSEGLRPGPVTSDRLSIPVTATASKLNRAFHVNLSRYRLPSGRTAFTTLSPPSVPSAAAPYVEGIVGLSDLYSPRSHLVRSLLASSAHRSPSAVHPMTSGPKPCAAADNAAGAYGTFTADQLASYYAMTPLYSLGDLGQGVHIALAEFEPNSVGDIAEYQACYGTNTTVNYITVDPGVGSGTGTGEAALDIEDVIGLAPRAMIDVYRAPDNGDQDTYDVYSAIVNDDRDNVVSTSWGTCELDSSPALITEEQVLFAQANSQGQTVFAASGDSGSTDCYGDPDTTHGATPSVDNPASQPYVLGVGGTSIGNNSETVWNDSGGAGGGGVSTSWCMPTYQDRPGIPGIISSVSQKDPTVCTGSTSYGREVPDISADADPDTGYTIYYSGTGTSFSGWGPIGGTSGAAPLWAAVAALIDSSPFCSFYGSNVGGDAGVLPAGLYSLADTALFASALYDVTEGNNDFSASGYAGGLYSATKGYDMASGLGTPVVSGFTGTPFASTPSMFFPGLAASMCWQYGTRLTSTHVTSVYPAAGPVDAARTVTVDGSGFLPISGADMALVGTKRVAATCPVTTRCTVQVPAEQAGFVNIRISAEDFTLSPVTVHDRYSALPAPTITKLTPGDGSSKGGSKITIRGSDFIQVTSVHFGGRAGTALRVVSPTELTVTAPPGSGIVYVTLSAIGGSSHDTSSSRYRYLHR